MSWSRLEGAMGSRNRHVGHGKTWAAQVMVRRQNPRRDRTPATGWAAKRQKCKARKFRLLLVSNWALLSGAVSIFIRMGNKENSRRDTRGRQT